MTTRSHRARAHALKGVRPLLGAARRPLGWLARQEALVLVTAFFIVLAVYGFIELATEMREGEMRDFDEWFLRLLRRDIDPAIPIGPAWLPPMMMDITALGGVTILALVTLIAAGYLVLMHRYGATALVIVASLGGGLLSEVLKRGFGRARPVVVPHLIVVQSLSFPSGHSMAAAVIYLTLGALLARFAARRRIRIYVLGISFGLTFLVGITRVYLGVHYPTDVLAGWAAGLAWALVCWLVARYLQYRGAVEQPGKPSPR